MKRTLCQTPGGIRGGHERDGTDDVIGEPRVDLVPRDGAK